VVESLIANAVELAADEGFGPGLVSPSKADDLEFRRRSPHLGNPPASPVDLLTGRFLTDRFARG
jgi:hypothetical protein